MSRLGFVVSEEAFSSGEGVGGGRGREVGSTFRGPSYDVDGLGMLGKSC